MTTNKILRFLKDLTLIFIILLACFAVFDLYAPIKQLISGADLSFKEVLAFINVKPYFPAAIGASVALAIRKGRTGNVSRQSD